MGPKVVLADRWRLEAEITSRLQSPTPVLHKRSLGIFRSSLTVQKLLKCIDLAGNLAFGFQNLEFSGSFDPRNVISYQRDPLRALSFSKPHRLSHRACRSIKPFRL
jgi:hypothetical protein